MSKNEPSQNSRNNFNRNEHIRVNFVMPRNLKVQLDYNFHFINNQLGGHN